MSIIHLPLFEGLFGLESQLKLLASLLADYRLGEANMLSASIVEAARAFSNYADSEIHSVSLELECCEREYVLKQEADHRFWGRVKTAGVLILFVITCIIVYLTYSFHSSPSISTSAQYRSSTLRNRSPYGYSGASSTGRY